MSPSADGFGTYSTPTGTVADAVRFSGTSTHAAAVAGWLEGGEYVRPGVETRDLSPMYVNGWTPVQPGDWIVKWPNGHVTGLTDEQFRRRFEVG